MTEFKQNDLILNSKIDDTEILASENSVDSLKAEIKLTNIGTPILDKSAKISITESEKFKNYNIENLQNIIKNPNANESEWLDAAHNLNDLELIQKNKLKINLRKKMLFYATFLAITGALMIGYLQWQNYIVQEKITNKKFASSAANIKSPDFKPYMKALQKAIHHYWKCDKLPHVIVTSFRISKTGEISGIKLERMSKNSNEDASAIQAIIDAMPQLPPLPPGSPNYVDITFTFESKSIK